MSSYQYRDSHTWKRRSLYWDGAWYGSCCSLNTASDFVIKWLLFILVGRRTRGAHSVNAPRERTLKAVFRILMHISIEGCCCGSNWQWIIIISSGIFFALNRRRAINWTNDDPVHWRIYPSIDDNELRTVTEWYSWDINQTRKRLETEYFAAFKFSVLSI